MIRVAGEKIDELVADGGRVGLRGVRRDQAKVRVAAGLVARIDGGERARRRTGGRRWLCARTPRGTSRQDQQTANPGAHGAFVRQPALAVTPGRGGPSRRWLAVVTVGGAGRSRVLLELA